MEVILFHSAPVSETDGVSGRGLGSRMLSGRFTIPDLFLIYFLFFTDFTWEIPA